MLLKDCLRIQPGEVLAFVGAGGKSSAISRLVGELQQTTPVLISTTTRLARGQSSLATAHFTTQDPSWAAELKTRMESGESVLLTAGLSEEDKWTSPKADDLLSAFAIAQAASGVMLVEADGARGRSLKAPAEHEPAMPSFATQVVLVCAIDAVGATLSNDRVHRPELAGPILGLEPGSTITPGHVAKLLADSRGGLKGVSPGVTVRCLVNKIQTGQQLSAGREIADSLLRVDGIQSISLSNLQDPDPVQEVYSRVAGVVLAAGGSARFGRQKLLEHWQGEPLIRHAVRAGLRTRLDSLVVVIGAERELIEQSLDDMPVRIAVNESWQEGQAGSLRTGLQAVPDRVEAVIFLLGDMPLIEPALISSLIREHQLSLGSIIVPTVGGKRGNPVLFDRKTFPALGGIQGDQGGRALYGRFPVRELPWTKTAAIDVDTLDDLRRLE
jgi:molybdenum cofactor cytidylyltransferase